MLRNAFALLSLIFALTILPGCGTSSSPAPEIETPPVPSSVSNLTAQDTNDNGTFYFGENILIKAAPGLPGQKKFAPHITCLSPSDSEIAELYPNSATEYYQMETAFSDKGQLVINLPGEVFYKLDPGMLTAIEIYSKITDGEKIYLLKRDEVSYLLMMSNTSATAGVDHLYQLHLIMPLKKDASKTDFVSLSHDPRRVWIDKDGGINYVEVDFVELKDYYAKTSEPIKLTMKVFGVKEDSELQPIDKFNVSCADVMGILPAP